MHLNKIWIKLQKLFSRTCSWKCYLGNISYFVKKTPIVLMLYIITWTYLNKYDVVAKCGNFRKEVRAIIPGQNHTQYANMRLPFLECIPYINVLIVLSANHKKKS